jgi:hypothetical protein
MSGPHLRRPLAQTIKVNMSPVLVTRSQLPSKTTRIRRQAVVLVYLAALVLRNLVENVELMIIGRPIVLLESRRLMLLRRSLQPAAADTPRSSRVP